MKTVNQNTNNEAQIEVLLATALPAGHGHRKITVYVEYEGQQNQFHGTTCNMPAYDAAQEMEGKKKYEALYDIIESKIEGDISEWIEEIEEKKQPTYPAWVTLSNGKTKIMHSESDAYSWAQSINSKITKVAEFNVPDVSPEYNPSNENVKSANRAIGGNDLDFIDGF